MRKKFLIKLLWLIPLTSLLSSCIPTAFIAGAASSVVIYDNRSMRTIAEDRNITYLAQKKINNNKELSKEANISVTSFNRVVLAVGQAPTSELRDNAISVIQRVPNVLKIYNEITIESPTSILASSNDTWLTTEVKAALLGKAGLRSSAIKILTEKKVVYLMGLVTHGQGLKAAEVASKVKGVKKVAKVFEYIN